MTSNIIKNKSKIIKINFKFKTYQKYNFKLFLSKIIRKIKGMCVLTNGLASLPNKKHRYTVLRSPHVDKKSREQFETNIYSQTLRTYFDFNNNFQKQNAKLLINFIKNSSSGLNLKITYTI